MFSLASSASEEVICSQFPRIGVSEYGPKGEPEGLKEVPEELKEAPEGLKEAPASARPREISAGNS